MGKEKRKMGYEITDTVGSNYRFQFSNCSILTRFGRLP